MNKRFLARKASAHLLSDVVQTLRKLQAQWPASTAQDQKCELHRDSGIYSWIRGIAKGLSEDEVFAYLCDSEMPLIFAQAFIDWCNWLGHDMYGHAQIDQQVVAWEVEIAQRQDRCGKGLSLVLKHRAKQLTRKQSPLASIFDRLTHASFPSELLLRVIEATVQRQVDPYWSATQLKRLEDLTGKLFLWPSRVPHSTRSVFQQIAANVLLKTSTIAVPVDFTTYNTLLIPPMLEGHEQHLRHLVLDLKTILGDGKYNRELNKSIKCMAPLAALLPNLITCVFLLHFRLKLESRYTGTGSEAFDDFVLRYKNLRQIGSSTKWEFVTLQDTIVELLATFALSGPGKRKFVRFSSNRKFRDDADKDYKSGIYVGPLVDVSCQVESTKAQVVGGAGSRDAATSSSEGAMQTEDSSIAHAKRIFDLAYRSPRVERRMIDG